LRTPIAKAFNHAYARASGPAFDESTSGFELGDQIAKNGAGKGFSPRFPAIERNQIR
jgi:hypothetical protein